MRSNLRYKREKKHLDFIIIKLRFDKELTKLMMEEFEAIKKLEDRISGLKKDRQRAK